jgi:hypothetical protein
MPSRATGLDRSARGARRSRGWALAWTEPSCVSRRRIAATSSSGCRSRARAHRSVLAGCCLVLLDIVLHGLNKRIELIRRGGRGHFRRLDPLVARRRCRAHSGSGVEGHLRRGGVCRSRARSAWRVRRGGGHPDRLDGVVRYARRRDPCRRHGRCCLDGRRGRCVARTDRRFDGRRFGGHRRPGGHGRGGDAGRGCSQPPQDETGTQQDRCDADAKARRALRCRRAR